MYVRITKELLPTPTKSHYTYNLRDISKIFQGVLEINYDHIQKKEDFFSLWAHECSRVFQDRLVNDEDREFFLNLLMSPLNNELDMTEWTKDDVRGFIFGDFANQNREYMQILPEQLETLPVRLNEFMMQYNASNP
jgi:dynein heavy chain